MGRLRVTKWPSINPFIARHKCSKRLTNVCPAMFAFSNKAIFLRKLTKVIYSGSLFKFSANSCRIRSDSVL